MKFLTEEWYRLYKQSLLGGKFLHECKHAAQYDEKLFRKLYRKAEKKWAVSLRSIPFGEDEETYQKALKKIEYYIGTAKTDKDRKKLEQFREDYIYLHEAARERDIKYSEIDDESANKSFAGRYQENMNTVKTLPQEILSKIADIRMLALGYATRENMNAIKAYVYNQGMDADYIWGKALDMVEEAESYMSHPSNLNEDPTGVMNGMRKVKNGVLLKFDDIPDIRVINGVVVKQEYPVYRWKEYDVLAPMTLMVGKELEYIDGKFRLSLLLENIGRYENVTAWELVVEGDDVIICN